MAGALEAQRRLRILQQLALDLAAARAPEDVCRVACDHALSALGALSVASWYLDGDGSTRVGSAAGTATGLTLPTPDLATFAAARGGRRVDPWLTEGLAELLQGEHGNRTRAAAMFAGDAVVGALAVVFDGDAPGDDPHLLGLLLRPAGEALARAITTSEALRLAAIVESSDDAMMVVDLDGNYAAWNPAARRITGFSAEEALGHRPDEILLPKGIVDPATEAAFARIRAGSGAQRLVAERRRKDGTTFVASLTLSPLRDPERVLLGVSVTIRDITAQRAAEARSRRLAAAVDASPSAVLVAELGGEVVAANSAADQIFKGAELVGSTLHAILGADPVIDDLVKEVSRGERVIREDTIAALGPNVQLELTGYPVSDETGEVIEVVLTLRDVTEQAAMAEELRRARSLEALGRLAGGIAHDFNNMLSVISGYVEEARMDVGDSEALTEIGSAAERLRGLTSQLLGFARRRPVTPVPLDVGEVARSLVPMLRPLLGPRVRLEIRGTERRPPSIKADRTQIEQVLVNLVLNARDAIEDHGDITIDLSADAGDLVLAVTDTGIGMSQETADRIFEPFFSTKGTGTGLGLATVHGAVTQAGGSIVVRSEPGRGTTFELRFKALEEQVNLPTFAPLPALPKDVADGEHVLVCDDEDQVLRLMDRALSRAGFSVTAVRDAEAAIRVIAADDPVDLLVTDVQMPGVSGYELARRALAARPDLPVVFVSGYAPDAPVLSPRTALVDKPFQAAELVAAVRDLLKTSATA